MTLAANRIWVAAAWPERDRNTTETGKLTFFASRIAMTHTMPSHRSRSPVKDNPNGHGNDQDHRP
jgi:hypothetical protein